jgi:uncharacterized protein (TIGR02284 family)
MNDEIEDVLNELIETSKDGEKGFMKAAEDAKDASLKAVFSEGAQRCREGARELQDVVRSLGGNPEKSGSLAGAMHRGWVSLKEAVARREDKAILEEVEKGEDYAKAQYKKALEQKLPPTVQAVVERQYRGVISNHDRVRALRDRYRAAAESESAWGRQQAAAEPSPGAKRGKMVGEDWPKSAQQDD